MTILTADKWQKNNRPDITVVRKGTQEWTLIDIAVPTNQNIRTTEQEKLERYRDLALEIKRIHRAAKVAATAINIGALATIWKNAKAWYWTFFGLKFFGSAQLSAILALALLLS